MKCPDYVSIKHIHCPAINALIAGEKENVLIVLIMVYLFIRGHSVEVGKNMQSFRAVISHWSQLQQWNSLAVWASVKVVSANNQKRLIKQLKMPQNMTLKHLNFCHQNLSQRGTSTGFSKWIMFKIWNKKVNKLRITKRRNTRKDYHCRQLICPLHIYMYLQAWKS